MSSHHLPSSFATTTSTASIPNGPAKLNLANIYRRVDQGLWSTVTYISLFHCGYFCPEIKLDELPSSKVPKNTVEEKLAGLRMDIDELTRVKDIIGILMAHLFELKAQAPATGSGGLEAAGGVGNMDKPKKEPQLHSRNKPAVKDSRVFKEFSGRRFIFGRLVEIYEVVQKCREERLREHYELCKDVKVDHNGGILVTPMFEEWNEVINGGKTGKSKGAAEVKKQQVTVSLPDLKSCFSGIRSSAMLNVVTKLFPRQSKPLSLNDYRDPGAPTPSTRPPVNPRPATQQKVQPIKREPVVSKWRPPTKTQNEPVEIVDSEDSEEERPKSEFVTAYEIHQKTMKNKNPNTQESKNPKGSRLNRPFVNPSSKRPSAETSDDGLDFRHGNSGGKNKKARIGLEDEEEQDPRLKNIDPQMVERIRNEIMGQNLNITWDDIAGLDHAKKLIEEIVVWPMLRPDIFKGLLSPPKGLLLFGPPGTGKTLIGKCIASQSNATFFSISSSSLTSKWIGDGEKMVRALFAVARCHQPAVVFVDEIDSLLTQRSDNEVEASRRIKTEFLVQLDGCTTSSEDRLLVIGATNRPQEIDEAARRRLQKRVYIALPEAHGRRKIITNLLKSQSYDLSEADLDEIARLTDGYSGSDMDGLCREAALNPIRALVSRMATASANDVRPINLQDFILAINQVRASVDSKELDLYIDWNSRFGSLSSNPNPSSTL